MKRSKTLPWPPVILAIMSLPQRIKAITPPIRRTARTETTVRMIFFFLVIGFLSFLDFFRFLKLVSTGTDEAVSSPLCSSKLKTWVGLRKSSVISAWEGVGALAVLTVAVAGLTGFDAGEIGVEFLLVLVTLTAVFAVVLVTFLTAGLMLAGVLVVVFLTGAAAFLERRGASPSIDLFVSIMYNYSIMSVKLTKKQLAVLNYLEDFTEENGFSPSYREIMAGLGLTSVSAVAEHIDNLVAKGALRKVPGAARSLEILDYRHTETVDLFKVKMEECTEEEKEVLARAAEILGLDLG